MKKDRMIAIDLLKIVFAILIFGRHANTMAGIDYPGASIIYNAMFSVMTGFFIVSGFNIQYNYGDKDILSKGNISTFYKKRLISIVPLYIFIHIFGLFINQYDLNMYVKLTPVDLLGIQTWYQTLFGTLHNGGTWFISCLLLAYFVYPIVQLMLKEMKVRTKLILFIILLGITIYSNYVIGWFQLADTYSSPLFRSIEFMIGVLLCELRPLYEKYFKKFNLIPLILAIVGLCYTYIYSTSQIVFYNCILLCALILPLSIVNLNVKGIMLSVVQYASSLCYGFFIMQCILWPIYFYIMSYFNIPCRIRYQILVATLILLFLTVITHELYEKPIQRRLKSKLG